jgi:hypothetical protein
MMHRDQPQLVCNILLVDRLGVLYQHRCFDDQNFSLLFFGILVSFQTKNHLFYVCRGLKTFLKTFLEMFLEMFPKALLLEIQRGQ